MSHDRDFPVSPSDIYCSDCTCGRIKRAAVTALVISHTGSRRYPVAPRKNPATVVFVGNQYRTGGKRISPSGNS